MTRRNPPGLPFPDARDVSLIDEPDAVLDRLIWLADLAQNDPKGKTRSYWERSWADLYMSWHLFDPEKARAAVKNWKGLPAAWLNRKDDIRLVAVDEASRAPTPCYRGYVRQLLDSMPPIDEDGIELAPGETDEHGRVYIEHHDVEEVDQVTADDLETVCEKVAPYMGYDIEGDAEDGFACSLESEWGDEFYRENQLTFRRLNRHGEISLRSNLCLVEIAYIEWELTPSRELRWRWHGEHKMVPAGNGVSQAMLADPAFSVDYEQGIANGMRGDYPVIPYGASFALRAGFLYGRALREHEREQES